MVYIPVKKDTREEMAVYLEKIKEAITEEVGKLRPTLEILSKIQGLPSYAIGTVLYQNANLRQYMEDVVFYVRRFVMNSKSKDEIALLMKDFDYYPRLKGIFNVFDCSEAATKLCEENITLLPDNILDLVSKKYSKAMKNPIRVNVTPWINGIMWDAYRKLNIPRY